MIFTNTKVKNQGFTIVELLIVVVVIAILAAITIVSYNGITNRANASAAASLAAAVQKKVELYAGEPDTNGYPATIADLTTASNSAKTWYVGPSTTTTLQIADPNSGNGKTTIGLLKCVSTGSPANQAAITSSTISGMRINYFNYEAGSGVKTINVGTTTTCPIS